MCPLVLGCHRPLQLGLLHSSEFLGFGLYLDFEGFHISKYIDLCQNGLLITLKFVIRLIRGEEEIILFGSEIKTLGNFRYGSLMVFVPKLVVHSFIVRLEIRIESKEIAVCRILRPCIYKNTICLQRVVKCCFIEGCWCGLFSINYMLPLILFFDSLAITEISLKLNFTLVINHFRCFVMDLCFHVIDWTNQTASVQVKRLSSAFSINCFRRFWIVSLISTGAQI